MSNILQRAASRGGSVRATLTRRFSTDALVESKPGEIGLVSGIPQEHLRRRVLCFKFFRFFFFRFFIPQISYICFIIMCRIEVFIFICSIIVLA